MATIVSLRQQLHDIETAKEEGTEAKTNFWRDYVRTMMMDRNTSSPDDNKFNEDAKNLSASLNEQSPLSKNEKNCIASAKSVIRKAHNNGIPVFVTDEHGNQVMDTDGLPKVRGKSELQEAQSDYVRISKCLGMADKIMTREGRELFTTMECDALAQLLVELAKKVSAEAINNEGE